MSDRQLAKIIADSISPHGVRLTTMQIVMPRIVLAEYNTHRMLTRSSASSRAVPIEKMLRMVEDDPYIPEQWDHNGSGMQGHGPLDDNAARFCELTWLRARDNAVQSVRQLLTQGLHKQTTNRLLEPFMWHTVITTATEWSNFFNLRCHPAAHPAIRRTAEAMRDAMQASTPALVNYDEWHLPYVDERDVDLSHDDKIKVSVARCARVSYLTHEGIRDPQADIDLHARLLGPGHMAPLEHAARPITEDDLYLDLGAYASEVTPDQHFVGNFRGWMQHRKTIPGEFDILAHRANES